MGKQNKANNKTNLVNKKTTKLSKDIVKHSKKLDSVAKLDKQRDNLIKTRDKKLFIDCAVPHQIELFVYRDTGNNSTVDRNLLNYSSEKIITVN